MEKFTGRYEVRGGQTVAIFYKKPYFEESDSGDAPVIKSDLEKIIANLKASGFSAEQYEEALANWPS